MAAQHLEKRGYRIVERNYRCPLGEIDLIARDAEGMVFVEVRTKRRPTLFSPEESVTPAKAHRLVRLAEHYLAGTGQEDLPWRVDVVAVELGPKDAVLRIEQIENAVSDVVW